MFDLDNIEEAYNKTNIISVGRLANEIVNNIPTTDLDLTNIINVDNQTDEEISNLIVDSGFSIMVFDASDYDSAVRVAKILNKQCFLSIAMCILPKDNEFNNDIKDKCIEIKQYVNNLFINYYSSVLSSYIIYLYNSISKPGYIGIDIADIKDMLYSKNLAYYGVGEESDVCVALDKAMHDPLSSFKSTTTKAFINIDGSNIKGSEVKEVCRLAREKYNIKEIYLGFQYYKGCDKIRIEILGVE